MPEEAESVMVDVLVMEPVELHVHGLGAFGDDGFVDNATGCVVVGL